MGKKNLAAAARPEWDPQKKEEWHCEFEKEPVNDEKWNCLVVAFVQNTMEDEECIQIFNECTASGLRPAIKTITMADVVSVLKEKGQGMSKTNTSKGDKQSKKGKQTMQPIENLPPFPPPPPKRVSPIVDVALGYAEFTETDCKLPTDLMAGLIKYLILNMKDQSVHWRKVNVVRERKIREKSIEASFIKSLQPFVSTDFSDTSIEINQDDSDWCHHPNLDPDLYIVLTGFYDPSYFSALIRMNVPFVALIKVANFRTAIPVKATTAKLEKGNAKEQTVANFWKKLTTNSKSLDTTLEFKDFLLLQYTPQPQKITDPKQLDLPSIYEEMAWMLYFVFSVHRRYQVYLQQMFVQRIILALEPLDLASCTVYNKLCDATVTGGPGTVFLILFAIVEQVASGVPHTESVPIEYEPVFTDYFSNNSDIFIFPGDAFRDSQGKNYVIVTPCLECRDKKYYPVKVCEKYSSEDLLSEKGEWLEPGSEKTQVVNNYPSDEISELSGSSLSTKEGDSEENRILQSFLDGQTIEEEESKEVRLKGPELVYYGDFVGLETYHCDPRLINAQAIVRRFLHRSSIPGLWTKHPKMPDEKEAFARFHFLRLLEETSEDYEDLKIKVLFALSMKLIGITKSYLYMGEEETRSDSIDPHLRDSKQKKMSKVRFDQSLGRKDRSFTTCLFTQYSPDKHNVGRLGAKNMSERLDAGRRSTGIRKTDSSFNLSRRLTRGVIDTYLELETEDFEEKSKHKPTRVARDDKQHTKIGSLLDCIDISGLLETFTMNSESEYRFLMKDFNFFETFEPHLMVQRLFDVKDKYNMIQSSYFPPTDTLIVIFHDDYDYRGVFAHTSYGKLATPVCLRDFYSYVFPEIKSWLQVENSEYKKLVGQIMEKQKEEEEKENKEWLDKLKRKYCGMTAEERENYLNNRTDNWNTDVEVKKEEMRNLPIKPKPDYPNKVSFIGTNFLEVRTETQTIVREYHSKDGTMVKMSMETWLYDSTQLLSLYMKKSNLRFVHHRWLEETNYAFTLQTESDLRFVFYKENEESALSRYSLQVTWPSGLLIRKVFTDRSYYIKQGYLSVYRKNSEIKDEKSRCYLNNGQILIFRENGDVEVLCGSGTKHILAGFAKPENNSQLTVSHYKTLTMTGEVWEKRSGSPCPKNKMRLIETMKVYIGTDDSTREVFYKRDDGVMCMLWPSGKLVTRFPDGTKITSTPEFDVDEINVTVPGEEIHSAKAETRAEAMEAKARKPILKSSAAEVSFGDPADENYVSISISYLMEHPKYATVFNETENSSAELKMPGQISVKLIPEDEYLVSNQNNVFLSAKANKIEFYTQCPDCTDLSTAVFFPGEFDMLAFRDFHGNSVTLTRKGEAKFNEAKDSKTTMKCTSLKNEKPTFWNSGNKHIKPPYKNQYCFAVERDLSGIEFVHSGTFAEQCYDLPADTFYDIAVKKGDRLINSPHVISIPQYKVSVENFAMDYEDKEDSLPTNLKRKDLQELGAKHTPKNLFKYPFPVIGKPLEQSSGEQNGTKRNFVMPKVMVLRIIKCIAENPGSIFKKLHRFIENYQKKSLALYNRLKNNRIVEEENLNQSVVQMKLQAIARRLDRRMSMYTHTCIQIPSTEADIHKAGHRLQLLEELRTKTTETWLQECKQIPHAKKEFELWSIEEFDEWQTDT